MGIAEERQLVTLGKWLRVAREAKGVSLEDAESLTRIKARYLRALELGDYGAMQAGEAQVRGFLRRYATFLGLSSEEAIARYEEEVPPAADAPHPGPVPATVSQPRSMDLTAPPRPIGLQLALIAMVVVILGLAAWWIFARSGLFDSPDPSPSPSPVVTPETVSAATTAEPTEVPATVAPAATFPVSASGGVTLTLELLEHVWVRVLTDGLTAYEGLMAPDLPIESRTWTAEELVIVETGNGAGVIASINGQLQGAIGGRGELCARGWGPEGEFPVSPSTSSDGSGDSP